MKRLLLVDDDYNFLQLLSSVMKKQCQVYEATGVQEAIKLLESVTVDAICSDFNMCDGTGLDFLKQLRKQEVRVPFILMSASDDWHILDEVQRLGASFCCKTDYDFVERIKKNINQRYV